MTSLIKGPIVITTHGCASGELMELGDGAKKPGSSVNGFVVEIADIRERFSFRCFLGIGLQNKALQ